MDDEKIHKNLIVQESNNSGNEVTEENENEKESEEISCLRRFFGPIRSGSLRGSTIALASITFGGGCLNFPYVVTKTGPILALLIFILVASFSYYTIKLLLDEGVKSGIMDYNNLVEHAMGRKMVVASDINNMILCLGVIMSYQLTVYRFALQLGNYFFGIDDKDVMNKLILVCSCFFIQVALSMIKNISNLQYASIVGTIALIYSIIVIVIEMFFYLNKYLEGPNSIPWLITPNWGYLDTFSTFMFGFSSHNGIYQIFMELKRPSTKRFNKILSRAFGIEIILYLSIAFGGYFSTFQETKDVFLDRPDLEGFNDIFIKIAKMTLFICLHCTMAINYNIMRMSFKSMWFNSEDIPFGKDLGITVFIYIISNALVFFISDVTEILGVIGGFCTILICFINPIVIHLNLSGKENTLCQNIIAYLILITVTIIGTAATCKSTYSIVQNVIKD
jgi:amino acid permease